MSRKVLAVEDDDALLASLARVLAREGYEVVSASDGSRGLALALRGDADVIVLDLTLPSLDGFKFLAALRSEGNRTPVLVLSGRREELDKVMALDLGADDYLTKPFSPAELLARLRALLRRSYASEKVTWGDVVLDLQKRLVLRAGSPVRLSPTAVTVLVALVRAKGAVVSRDELFALVRPGRTFGTRRVVDNAIVELRRALEEDPENPRFILTARGLGYRFAWENLESH